MELLLSRLGIRLKIVNMTDNSRDELMTDLVAIVTKEGSFLAGSFLAGKEKALNASVGIKPTKKNMHCETRSARNAASLLQSHGLSRGFPLLPAPCSL